MDTVASANPTVQSIEAEILRRPWRDSHVFWTECYPDFPVNWPAAFYGDLIVVHEKNSQMAGRKAAVIAHSRMLGQACYSPDPDEQCHIARVRGYDFEGRLAFDTHAQSEPDPRCFDCGEALEPDGRTYRCPCGLTAFEMPVGYGTGMWTGVPSNQAPLPLVGQGAA